jgi:hypothetical protein
MQRAVHEEAGGRVQYTRGATKRERHAVVALALALVAAAATTEQALGQAAAQERAQAQVEELGFTGQPEWLRFAVIGDSGTGGRQQREIGERMEEVRQRFPFEFVLMLGDNMYGGESPKDFERKFEQPFAALLKAGVKFYAAIGNHDELSQRYYPLFNMDGRRHYKFSPRPGVRVIALDSTNMDAGQLHWLQDELERPDGPPWTFVFMHHPLYSSGRRHGPSLELREALEPLFVRTGVDVVFSGHEHFYERLRPQQGIHYFISGAAAKLREGNIDVSDGTACGFDQDNSFMVFELNQDALQFASISRDGMVIDRGRVGRDGRDGGASECLADNR